jgi:phosphoinositide-3-kinase regulatory subunit
MISDVEDEEEDEFVPQEWIENQHWYWGNVSKEAIAIAMQVCFYLKKLILKLVQNQPTGTFCIRDASTPGDYTLTVRINDANKLVKIYVVNGNVGFTKETLDFDSVVDLVDYYRHCSLEEHNPALKTSLKFPLIRTKQKTTQIDEDEALVPDRMPKKLTDIQNVT